MRNLKSIGLALAVIVCVFGSEFQHVSKASGVPTQRYRLDASQSKFLAHALAGGLFWFRGHEHLVAVREFRGRSADGPCIDLSFIARDRGKGRFNGRDK